MENCIIEWIASRTRLVISAHTLQEFRRANIFSRIPFFISFLQPKLLLANTPHPPYISLESQYYCFKFLLPRFEGQRDFNNFRKHQGIRKLQQRLRNQLVTVLSQKPVSPGNCFQYFFSQSFSAYSLGFELMLVHPEFNLSQIFAIYFASQQRSGAKVLHKY